MIDYVAKAMDFLKQHKEEFERASQLQMALWNGLKIDKQPLLLSCGLSKEENEALPDFNTKETHYDSEKMFLSGLKSMMSTAYGGADGVPSIRANMGCGIFPTLFGIKQQLFDDKMPWVKEHLSKEVLAKMGPEDLKIGDEFKAGLDHILYIADKISDTGCKVFPLDLQGVYDTAHLVYGDAIFYDMYDDPQFVHHLMELSCEAIILGMEECLSIIPDSDKAVAHYNSLVMPRSKGGIKVSEDTSTLLSMQHIDEFVSPYLNKLLSHFGGGYVHYCGKNPYLFELAMKNPLVFGLNLGNPDMHDMEYVLRRCAEVDKIYYGSIPRNHGENLNEYFEKYLTASKKGDRSLLLLQFGCSKDNKDTVLESWSNASQGALSK